MSYTDDPDNPLYGLFPPPTDQPNTPNQPSQPDTPNTPEPQESNNLQAELLKYKEAFKQEYEASQAASDTQQLADQTRSFFKEHIHSAAAQIVWLAQNSQSESARLNASKYVIDQALNQPESPDPIKDLLKELSSNPAPDNLPDKT